MKIRKLDDGDFLVHLECDLRSIAERKMYVKVNKQGTPVHPELMPILVRFGRALRMVEMMKSGDVKTRSDLASELKMTVSRVSRIIRIAFLSPVIVEKIVKGEIAVSRVMSVQDKLIMMPIWADQHRLVGIE